MVFLIDDNQSEQQQERYHAEFLFDDSFKQELELIYKIETYKLESIGEKLKIADAILMHHTFADFDWAENEYLKGSTKARDFIESIAEKYKIPFVLFSNNSRFEELVFDNNEQPTKIRTIRKDVFYSHLFEFLGYYKEHKAIELKILGYGKDYKIQDAINYIEKLIEQLKNSVPSSEFSDKLIDLPAFEHFYKSLEYGRFEDFWNDSELRTVAVFISKIKKIKKSLLRYERYL